MKKLVRHCPEGCNCFFKKDMEELIYSCPDQIFLIVEVD